MDFISNDQKIAISGSIIKQFQIEQLGAIEQLLEKVITTGSVMIYGGCSIKNKSEVKNEMTREEIINNLNAYGIEFEIIDIEKYQPRLVFLCAGMGYGISMDNELSLGEMCKHYNKAFEHLTKLIADEGEK